MKFENLNLSNELLKAIQEKNYKEATYIQSATIPSILNNGDVIGHSQTGTGKTAAFLIPLIQRINKDNYKNINSIILAPTRELAIQINDELMQLSKYISYIKSTTIYGGVAINKQIQALKTNITIVVGTPGRILDHLKRKTLKLNKCQTIVLDEADEMLNMGFKEDIEKIISYLNIEHQTILFSATMPKAILDLKDNYQNNPIYIKNPSNDVTSKQIHQYYYEVNNKDKTTALLQLLMIYEYNLAIIFCNTKKTVDDLVLKLIYRGFLASSIHGDMKQENRQIILQQFKKRQLNILVATDVAARGLDINNMDIVINYDYPTEDQYYIHRIGRTGRANKEGIAITFLTPRQKNLIKVINKKTKSKIIKKEMPKHKEIVEKRLNTLEKEIYDNLDINIPNIITNTITNLNNEHISNEKIASYLLYKFIGKEQFEKPIKPIVEDSLIVKNKKQSTILVNIGHNQKVQPSNFVSAIASISGLNGKYIGKINIKKDESFINIPLDYDKKIVKLLNNTLIKGIKVKVTLYKSNIKL